jgi:hypothetical protein
MGVTFVTGQVSFFCVGQYVEFKWEHLGLLQLRIFWSIYTNITIFANSLIQIIFSTMNNTIQTFRFLFYFIAITVFTQSCSSTTVIQSEPPGARLFINGEFMGSTPYTLTDTKVAGTTNWVRLEMEGYETLYTSFSRTERVEVGAIVAGFFVWVPFAWGLKYKPFRTFMLAPLYDEYYDEWEEEEMPHDAEANRDADRYKALREIKQLYDDGILTTEEFEKEKQRILERQK